MRAGTTIDDRFAIEREVGSGGMGKVYRAHDRERDLPVAVKVLASLDESDRFAREGAVLAELVHPGVVRYVAQGYIYSSPYLVTEWIDGITLGAYLDRAGLTAEQGVVFVRRLAEALAYAHARGILHRDLKPSNVMLVGGDITQPKLIDFGLARRARETVDLTAAGSTIGTPGYMAPEQVRGQRDLDARADVFALGCLLYECLTNVPAFAGGDWLVMQTRILLAAPQLPPTIPSELARVLEAMLAKERERRPSDASAVVELLDAVAVPAAPAVQAARTAAPMPTLRSAPSWRYPGGPGCFVIALVDAPPPGFAAEAFGGELQPLHDGALVIKVSAGDGESAIARADRCAQALHVLAPRAPIAVAATPEALAVAAKELLAAHLAMQFGRDVPTIRILT